MSERVKNSNDVFKKITDWLTEEAHTFNFVDDAYADFHIEFDYGNSRFLHIIFYKNKRNSMNISTKVEFSPLDQKAFSSLAENAKKDFLLALSSSLCNMNLTHTIQPSPDRMEYLLITKRIFFDGLTKDKLFDTLDRVFNGMGLAYLTYTRYLSKAKGSNSSSLASFFF